MGLVASLWSLLRIINEGGGLVNSWPPAAGFCRELTRIFTNWGYNEDMERLPLIVGFVSDLMVSVRIGKVAEHLGFAVRWVGSASEIGEMGNVADIDRPGEITQGTGSHLFNAITKWQPVLLIFDLGNEAIPWERWIAQLKSSPATRRIPILCFGPHVEVAMLQSARGAGANEVVARSRFMRAMPDLIQKQARVHDKDGIGQACDEGLLPDALTGIGAFNRGAFYEAHDGLEAAWFVDRGSGRDLYRAILQIAIAYYQIERGNFRGAIKMLLRVRQWLEPLPDVCRTVDIVRLREDVERVHGALAELGEERLGELDRGLFRPVKIVDSG